MLEHDPRWRDANQLAAQRRWADAAALLEAVAADHAGVALAWIALAQARGRVGQPRGEHAAAMRAAALGPGRWSEAIALARLLLAQHEVPALAALSSALATRADEAKPAQLLEIAQLVGQADLHDEALRWAGLALAREPGAPAYFLRGTTRQFLGDLAGAREDLERAIAAAPHFAHAHWRLSAMAGDDPAGGPARVQRLRTQQARVPRGSELDVHFSFALYAELEALGRHDEAWEALARGNRDRRAQLRYSPADDAALFSAIRAACDARFVSGPGFAGEGPRPVFIIGLFRSGTTVLEQMLAGHPDVADGGESLAFTACLRRATDHRGPELLDPETLRRAASLDYAALGADFMAGSAWRASGRRLWTEKLPPNFLNAGLIARALPGARFIHMQRPAMDVCFSNLRQLYAQFAPWCYDQAELADYYLGYRGLMDHWREVLGERLLDVAHADLVADPEAQMRRVLAHCGLDWDPRVLDLGAREGAVSTASATQVRAGLRAPSAPAWHAYRRHLGVLEQRLGAPDATPAAGG